MFCFPFAAILFWLFSKCHVIKISKNFGDFVPRDSSLSRRSAILKIVEEKALGTRLYLIVPFWYASAAYQASLVEPWSLHATETGISSGLMGHLARAQTLPFFYGSYFGETQSSQNTHGETKRAWYAAEAYQKGTIRYLPCPNSYAGNSDSIVSVWLFKCLSTQLASVFQFSFGGKDFRAFFRSQNTR